MEKRTLRFRKVKETKNTVKFEEVPEAGQPPAVGTLYVQKWFAGMIDKVLVTIEP
jgi:hypothetical protein